MKTNNQKGQIVVILLLVMVITLAIGLSVIGRSITEISNSTRTEEAARAFSAAEAGIEKAFLENQTSGTVEVGSTALTNSSTAQVNFDRQIPPANTALEYPPFGKESFAHFWLADPETLASSYPGNNFEVYFGTAKDYTLDPGNQPAIQLHLVIRRNNEYTSQKFLVDSFNGSAAGRDNNGFVGCTRDAAGLPLRTNNYTEDRRFYCRATITYALPNNAFPVLVRVRMLYSNISHPIAIRPTGGRSLPPQVSIYKSIGSSGTARRDLQVFQQKYVVPHFFDYVLFSSGEIAK